MSDNKDFDEMENGLSEDAVTDEKAVEGTTSDLTADEPVDEMTEPVSESESLDKELEELRDVFQQELDKAVAASESEDGQSVEEVSTDEEDIAEENLCLCCGEKEKMEGCDYCEDCHEAMRRYPFKWVYFIVAVLAVYVAVLAVVKVAQINRGWVYSYEADVLSEAGWYNEATEKYKLSTNYLYTSKVEPKIVYVHNLENAYKAGGFSMINSFPTSVATLFEEWELNLPHMKNLKQYYMRAQIMAATIQQVNEEVFSKYAETASDEMPYDDIIKQINDFEGRMLHIGLDENGNEIEEKTTSKDEYDGTMSTSDAVYFKRTEKYDKAMLQYFKYYFATTCNRPYDERIALIESVRANEPEMTWLYAGDLAIEYAENGEKDKALEVCDIIQKNSETDVIYHYVRAIVAKKIDHDFDAAIDFCNQGIELSDNYEFHRQIALNYLAKGDYENAQKSAQEAYDEGNDWTTANTLMFCALANGDKEKVKEIDDMLASYNKDLGEGEEPLSFLNSVLELREGKKSVSEILEKGGYDLND